MSHWSSNSPRRPGLDLAVRSGGHSAAAHSSTEGGILLDLGGMKAIDIDVDGKTVWAETGLTAAELTTAVGEHRQASPIMGRCEHPEQAGPLPEWLRDGRRSRPVSRVCFRRDVPPGMW